MTLEPQGDATLVEDLPRLAPAGFSVVTPELTAKLDALVKQKFKGDRKKFDSYLKTTGSKSVTVTDTTAPALALPGSLTAEATSAAGASVSFATSDNCESA